MSIYRARNLVERFINKVKHGRCVATRYDKLAANYLAFVQLASICLWLRVNASTSGVPIPKFASLRCTLVCELRNQRDTSNL